VSGDLLPPTQLVVGSRWGAALGCPTSAHYYAVPNSRSPKRESLRSGSCRVPPIAVILPRLGCRDSSGEQRGQAAVSDIVVQVGIGRGHGSLTGALAALSTIAAQAAPGDRIVLVLRDPTEQHPPGPISLPSGVDRLLIRGRGTPSTDGEATLTAGVMHTTVYLPTGHGDIRPLSGADIEYQDIRFSISGDQPRSLFLQDAGDSTLRFRNCVASGASAATVDQAFARLRGPNDRLIADGLRIGLGFSHGIDARTDPAFLASSPLVDLRRCGFRELVIGVRLDNVSHARVRESVFADCGVGLWTAYTPGAPPGGVVHAADNRFTDCGIGFLLRDRSSRAAVAGPVPADGRPFQPDEVTIATTPAARRQIRLVRNEFRAPDTMAFPAKPSTTETGWGLRDDEAVGVHAEFDPHPASQASPWPPQLLLQANIFHLLDHGVGLLVGQHGQVAIDHCTFVANFIRSVFVSGVATSGTRELGLVVARNIFQSNHKRPWLGTHEGAEPPDWDGSAPPDPRYRFGGVELWGAFGDVVMRSMAWVASNLFADFGTARPHVYSVASAFGGEAVVEIRSWEGAVTSGPMGISTWRNQSWDDTSRCVVLRLPRVRRVQGGALTMVEFDYHAVLGTAAAPAGILHPADFDGSWLASQSVQLSSPGRDCHGEDMSFHPLSSRLLGAGRERRAWQAWPLIGWAARANHLGRTVDAAHSGSPVYLHKSPTNATTLSLAELELSFNGGLPDAATNAIAAASAVEGGVVVVVSFFAYCGCEGHDSPCREGVVWEVVGKRMAARLVPVCKRVWVEENGRRIELPVRSTESYDGGEWSIDFVEYWLDRLRQYVTKLTAADSTNRIAGWVLGDENPAHSWVVETMARARELIERVDPLRRPVLVGMQSSDARPHWGGLPTVVGGVPLDRDTTKTLPERSWRPASWSSQRGAALFLDRQPRSFRGSLKLASPINVGRVCLDGQLGATTVAPATSCKDDFGVILAAPLSESGQPRFTTHHVQSSWHFNRSVDDADVTSTEVSELHATNRSYAHHHGLVLRDTLELGRLIADRALVRTRQDGHTFFNAPVLNLTPVVKAAPTRMGSYRHDFWAGIHHAGGVYTYSLGSGQYVAPGTMPASSPQNLLSRAFDEGMELLKGTNADGEGLREALANGQRWQTMRVGDPGPPWLSWWARSPGDTANIDFGIGAGRTLGDPLFQGEGGYYDLCTTALRLGTVTWLIITKSTSGSRWIEFGDPPACKGLMETSASLTQLFNGRWRLEFGNQIDATVLRLS